MCFGRLLFELKKNIYKSLAMYFLRHIHTHKHTSFFKNKVLKISQFPGRGYQL